MSQNFQFPNNQGSGPNQGFGYGPPPTSPYPPNNGAGGGSALKIILIVVGVVGVLGLLMCGVLAALLIPAVGAAREAAQRVQDQNSLKQIGLAIHNYESAYKRMPAPKVVNIDNVPVYAWSIPLLPYMEQSEIYNRINWMNMQPWDSPMNAGLFDGTAPLALQSVRAKLPPRSNECNVFLISAPGRVQGANPLFIEGVWSRFSEVTDGLSNTLMAIQLVNHSVPWASPTTLSVDEAYQFIQNEDRYFNALMGDGSVISVPTSIDQQTFTALVTRDGGEAVNIPEYTR
jgi:Protein of unknown function (DUF1559)